VCPSYSICTSIKRTYVFWTFRHSIRKDRKHLSFLLRVFAYKKKIMFFVDFLRFFFFFLNTRTFDKIFGYIYICYIAVQYHKPTTLTFFSVPCPTTWIVPRRCAYRERRNNTRREGERFCSTFLHLFGTGEFNTLRHDGFNDLSGDGQQKVWEKKNVHVDGSPSRVPAGCCYVALSTFNTRNSPPQPSADNRSSREGFAAVERIIYSRTGTKSHMRRRQEIHTFGSTRVRSLFSWNGNRVVRHYMKYFFFQPITSSTNGHLLE